MDEERFSERANEMNESTGPGDIRRKGGGDTKGETEGNLWWTSEYTSTCLNAYK